METRWNFPYGAQRDKNSTAMCVFRNHDLLTLDNTRTSWQQLTGGTTFFKNQFFEMKGYISDLIKQQAWKGETFLMFKSHSVKKRKQPLVLEEVHISSQVVTRCKSARDCSEL